MAVLLVVVFVALVGLCWANYRIEVRLAELRAELERFVAGGLERELLQQRAGSPQRLADK